MTVSELGKRAKSTQSFLSMATTDDKNKALRAIAISLIENQDKIIAANKTDPVWKTNLWKQFIKIFSAAA